jgi:hypothetical protein
MNSSFCSGRALAGGRRKARAEARAAENRRTGRHPRSDFRKKRGASFGFAAAGAAALLDLELAHLLP